MCGVCMSSCVRVAGCICACWAILRIPRTRLKSSILHMCTHGTAPAGHSKDSIANQSEAVEAVAGFTSRGLHVDVLVLDYLYKICDGCTEFDPKAFPDPSGMVAAFKAQVRACEKKHHPLSFAVVDASLCALTVRTFLSFFFNDLVASAIAHRHMRRHSPRVLTRQGQHRLCAFFSLICKGYTRHGACEY
jgi:hypothetical protein